MRRFFFVHLSLAFPHPNAYTVSAISFERHRRMNKHNRIAVLGGDERQSRVAEFFAKEGKKTEVYGLSEDILGVTKHKNAIDAVKDCDAVIFPLPAVKNGVYLNEKSDTFTPIESILDALSPSTEIYAGKADGVFRSLCKIRELSLIDYYDSEPLTVKNAHLTAEGALYIYMTEKKTAVLGSRVLVIGSGRVAKCTAHVFSAVGADVTVMARNRGELAFAELSGHGICDLTSASVRLTEFSSGYDAIINTVPVTFMTGCYLSSVPTETLIIDLASVPYGVDVEEARRLGLNAVRATSLPGKYAPETAGKLIAETISARMEGKL